MNYVKYFDDEGGGEKRSLLHFEILTEESNDYQLKLVERGKRSSKSLLLRQTIKLL